jgi:hypothetical protein
VELLPDVHGALFGSTSSTDLIATAGRALVLGHVLWIVAYGLILARSARTRLLGIPLAAIILNITWETLLYANCPGVGLRDLCGPALGGEWSLALAFILTLDVLLLAQAFVLTAAGSGFARTALVFIVALAVVYILHANLIGLTLDYRGLVDSWIVNAVMSALFVRLALSRPNGEGLSFLAAIAKLLGSQLVTLGLWIAPDPYAITGVRTAVVYGLAAAVLLLDLWYIVLLWRRLPAQDRLA